MARTLTLEFKTADFKIRQKCITFPDFFCHVDDLKKYAMELVNNCWPMDPCRMISVKLSNLKIRTEKDDTGPKVDSSHNIAAYI